jgi:hypothetical protein
MGIAGAVGVQWELPGAVARRGRGRVREHDQARLRPRRRSVGRENGHPAASRMDRRLQQNRSPLFSRNAFPKGVSCPQPSDFMCLEIWGAEHVSPTIRVGRRPFNSVDDGTADASSRGQLPRSGFVQQFGRGEALWVNRSDRVT